MKRNIWIVLFFTLLIINLVFLTIYFISNRNSELESKNEQIDILKSELRKSKSEFIENAEQLKYLLETIIENSTELKKYMIEYKDVSEKDFEEKLRQKIVRLDIEIERKKENN
ncbi:MAG: hypothetical protein SFU99_21250 [Saprospiraceae bacterium]|nr:hypothetical protein [Saprospiraceae bacterium]